MTIMTKKIQAGEGLPTSYKSLKIQFIDVYQHLLALVEDGLSRQALQQTAPQTRIDLSAMSFDDMQQTVTGLLFAAEARPQGANSYTENRADTHLKNDIASKHSGEPNCQILIEISPHLAQSMINAKLGETTTRQSSFSLFDSLLMQPMAKLVLDGLNALGENLTNADIVSRSTSMDRFQNIKFARSDTWVKLHFPISLKACEKPQKKPGQKKSAKGKAKNNAQKNEKLYLALYMTRPLADTLIGNSPNPASLPVVDLEDPWSRHMYNTVLSARRSLEIVIEDLNFSVAACTRLEPGQIISLPGASHERLKVKTRSASGNIVLAGATLGAFKANKAVKLNEDIDPAFTSELGAV